MLLSRRLQELLQASEENIQEFLSILLNRCVRGIAVKVFEGKAESQRVESLAFGQLQVGEHDLQLLQEVIVNDVALILFEIVGGLVDGL